MRQQRTKECTGKKTKWVRSQSLSPRPGRCLRRLTLLPTLVVLALAVSHSRCQVVEARNGPGDEQMEADGDLAVIDEHEHDASIAGLPPRPRPFVEDAKDCEGDDVSSNDYGTSDADKGQKDLIVVVSVDGTLAGICKKTGKVLWKQSRQNMDTQQSHTMKPNKIKPTSSQARLLQPVVSTTTTTKSAATSDYVAVPSVDGSVYLTSNEVTVTTSVRELVARAPFLDNKGRFYVGSRHATAAALDGDTGEILHIVSAAEVPDREDKSLEGRNTIWVGRVDYAVSVQNARTGMVDAQFSVANIMSVSDMQGSEGVTTWNSERQGDSRQSPTTPSDDTWTNRFGLLPASKDESSVLTASDGQPSALLATPSGNLAYRDSDSGEFRWVAEATFDSPIAFAMDANSGFALRVDIIPDVPVPDSPVDILSREMERQLDRIQGQPLELQDQTIVGAMATGQLYALPLGGQSPPTATATLQQHAAVASASAANTALHIPKVPQITGGRTNLHHQAQSAKQAVATKRHCDPLSSQFPACLVGHTPSSQHYYPHRFDHSTKVSKGSAVSDPVPPKGDDGYDTDEVSLKDPARQYIAEGGFYHPDVGYVSAQDLQRIQQRLQPGSSKRTLLRIMSSWLPPTIALIFVLSFELGRRKRLKDNQKALVDQQQQKKSKVPDDSMVRIDNHPQRAHQYVIQVSDEVLGYGGQGTVVYKGMLDGRSVAVKRMLSAYHASADREISLLIESDGHPNVVRYFLKEVRGDFVYLALELCSLSLHDLIGVLRQTQECAVADPIKSAICKSSKSILFQIASGVKHIHNLRIVHRDLKPANILLALSGRVKGVTEHHEPVIDAFIKGSYIAKISDMGLGKQLVGQSSLGASLIAESSFRGSKPGASSVGVGPGSVGWQAPEVMAARWTSSDSSTHPEENSGNAHPESASCGGAQQTMTSRSVDIFSLGCIFYSALVPGNHPFGEWYEREANIMHNRPKLGPLKKLSPDAYDLVSGMLNRNPRIRPTAKEICEHPFFWTDQKKLVFLCEFSDRLETDACAADASLGSNALAIERGAAEVVGTAWHESLDNALISNVQKFRTYDTTSVRDLLRLIRNKHHHFDELPADFREAHACDQSAFLEYFVDRFPLLLMHCYDCCRKMMSRDDPFASKYCIVPNPAKEATSTPGKLTSERIPERSGSSDEIVNPTMSVQFESVRKQDLSVPKIALDVNGEVSRFEEADPAVEESDQLEQGEVELSVLAAGVEVAADNIVAWEGGTVAKALNCRGWSRSEDEWSTRIDPCFRKCDQNLRRALEDPKFRTRLCNHWDESLGTFCPMRKKNKCVFAHGPVELRVKELKKHRWGKLVDRSGNNSNPCHSGGEDTYGAARSIESARKVEGKWNTPRKGSAKGRKQTPVNKKKKTLDS